MKKIILSVVIILLLGAGGCLAQEVPEGFYLYRVKPGDTFSKIAPSKHWDIIKRANRIDEKHLPAGKEILIPNNFEKARLLCPVCAAQKKFSEAGKTIIIFLDSQYFAAYENGEVLFWGPISSGKATSPTLKGKFKALWKSRNYYSKKYDVKMPFAVCFSNAGYFLHAQSLPGKPASHGCVRLLNEDAKKIFVWIKKGDRVIVE